MLQVTDYVMRFAPFAVFAAVASDASPSAGPRSSCTYGKFIGSFYLGLVILWALLIGACFLIVGPRTRLLVRYIRDPIVLAFSTASSRGRLSRARWKRSTGSACRRASPASSCRSAIRSTSTAR